MRRADTRPSAREAAHQQPERRGDAPSGGGCDFDGGRGSIESIGEGPSEGSRIERGHRRKQIVLPIGRIDRRVLLFQKEGRHVDICMPLGPDLARAPCSPFTTPPLSLTTALLHAILTHSISHAHTAQGDRYTNASLIFLFVGMYVKEIAICALLFLLLCIRLVRPPVRARTHHPAVTAPPDKHAPPRPAGEDICMMIHVYE